MANTIQHKRSSTSGVAPAASGLSQGELAINIADGKLYTKNNSNTVINLGVTSISGTYITPASGNFSNSLKVNGVEVSVSGHNHDKVTSAGSLSTAVFNKTGNVIPKFSVVYINGGQGDQPTINLAIGDGESGSSKTYGITAEAISNMASGTVIVAGALTGVNTDQFNPTAPTGDVNGSGLWLSPSVSGGVTLTKPSAPNHAVYVATIVRTHQNAGVVEVRVQNGFELQELHNVALNGTTNGQFLQYNSGSGLWVASSSGNFTSLNLNSTGVVASTGGTSNYLSKFTGSNTIGNSLIFDNGTNVGIGTAAPSVKLEVIGDIFGNNILSTGYLISNSLISINDFDGGNPGSIAIGEYTSLQQLYWTIDQSGSGNFSALSVNDTTVSLDGHSHLSSDITNFNSSVSGLLPVKNIVAGNNITVTSSSGTYTINSTATGGAGLQSSSYISQGKLSGNQSVTSGSDAVIQFVDDYDPQSWFNTTTRRFQPNIAGYYLISVGAWMDDADTTNGQANVQIRLNNNTILLVQNQLNDVTGLSLTGSKAVYLNGTTDYIDFTFYHSTGSSRSLLSGGDGTFFTAVFLAWSAPPIGTENYISKFGTSGSGVINSLIYDNGTNIGIGTTSPSSKLHVIGSGLFSGDVRASGSFIGGSGTAALPSFEFINDPDTGLFSPAANTFGISTGGTERLRITSNGGMVLGTEVGGYVTAGNHKIQAICPNSVSMSPLVLIGGNAGIEMYKDSAVSAACFFGMSTPGNAATDDFYISMYGGSWNSPFFIRNSDGNVGIGTVSPYSKLQVNGNLSVGADGFDVFAGAEGIVFGTDGSVSAYDTGPGLMFSIDSINGLKTYGDGSSSNAVILSTDRSNLRVGIKAETPDATLHVGGDVHIEGALQSAGPMLYLWSNFK
jgi:hypothetical protein